VIFVAILLYPFGAYSINCSFTGTIGSMRRDALLCGDKGSAGTVHTVSFGCSDDLFGWTVSGSWTVGAAGTPSTEAEANSWSAVAWSLGMTACFARIAIRSSSSDASRSRLVLRTAVANSLWSLLSAPKAAARSPTESSNSSAFCFTNPLRLRPDM
jgi:hypothetical protein